MSEYFSCFLTFVVVINPYSVLKILIIKYSNKRGKEVKNKRKDHGAVDETSSE